MKNNAATNQKSELEMDVEEDLLCTSCGSPALKMCATEIPGTRITLLESHRRDQEILVAHGIKSKVSELSPSHKKKWARMESSDFCVGLWCTKCGNIIADHDDRCPVKDLGYPLVAS